ncbi:hypothetical protein V9T40_001635 [Parthenolecanium corni]|uniref:Uncharacterized protein n=1 Tax=Parthenolecanium corni TaxID=536013 RepID=A0AAN9TJ29_9HEMI
MVPSGTNRRYRKAHPDKVSDAKQYRTTPDWSDEAVNGDHLWTPAQMSGDLCYAGDMLECTRISNSMRGRRGKDVASIICLRKAGNKGRSWFGN